MAYEAHSVVDYYLDRSLLSMDCSSLLVSQPCTTVLEKNRVIYGRIEIRRVTMACEAPFC